MFNAERLIILSIGQCVEQVVFESASASFVTNELVLCPHFYRPWTIDQGVLK